MKKIINKIKPCKLNPSKLNQNDKSDIEQKNE